MIRSLIKFAIAVSTLSVLHPFEATAAPYNFQGRNFCLTEDARVMNQEGVPDAQPVSNAPKSFRLTYGPVANKNYYAFEIDGAGIATLEGLYSSTDGQGTLFVADEGVGFGWTIPSTGKVQTLALTTGGTEETPIWLVVTAQCYKAD